MLVGGTGMMMEPINTGMDADSDDLRSYEAAVVARKVPTMLNLRPMKGRGRPPGAAAVAGRDEGSGNNSSGCRNNSPSAIGGGDAVADCSSSSSSLANAFGTGCIPVSSSFHLRDQTVLSSYATLPFAGAGILRCFHTPCSPIIRRSKHNKLQRLLRVCHERSSDHRTASGKSLRQT